MLTKRTLTPLVAGLLLVGLSACGSDDKKSDATTAATEAAAEPAPTDGGTDATDAPSDVTDAVTEATAGGGGGSDAGSEFCVAAEQARTLGDAVDLDNGTPEEIETGVKAAIEAITAAGAVAPDEIKDVIAQVTSYQQQFADVLEKYDWDLTAALNAPELADLANEDVQGVGDQLDAYLTDHCGITN